MDSLQKALEALTVENRALKAKVSEFGRKLTDEKSCFWRWCTNCQSLVEYDKVISAKEVEIEELKHQLYSLTATHSLPSGEIHAD